MTNPTANRRRDLLAAITFSALTLGFLAFASMHAGFSAWIWARHHNVLSWYVRPLFLIPFCLFAYRRSWGGLAGTIFALATSMAWFPVPEVSGPQVSQFLSMEQGYLHGEWDGAKLAMTMLVPLTLGALAAAFWQRKLWLGILVLMGIAGGKMTWAVAFGGESGKAIFGPALLGLALCAVAVWLGFRRLERRPSPSA